MGFSFTSKFWPLVALCALILACGGGESQAPDGGSGDLLVGQDCPDSCIPRCVFVALSTIRNAMPAGNSVVYGGSRCYENGVVEFGGCSGTGQQRDFYKNGMRVLRWTASFTQPETGCEVGGPINPAAKPTFLEVKGSANELLVQGRADEATPSMWTFICDGGTRMVDLTVNATNAACRSCPADFVRLPIPPLPIATFGDANCHP